MNKDNPAPVKDEFIKKHLENIWQITKESQIERFIKPMFQSLEAASIEYFLQSGTVSGNFYLNLHKMMDAVRNWKSQSQSIPAPVEMMNDFVKFALNTFKDASALSSLEKLEEEILEIAFEIQHGHENLAEEYVDCIMCILDSAARMNIMPDELMGAFAKKLEVNKSRTWIKNENNTYSHE